MKRDCAYRFIWDKDHSSPPIGPFKNETAMKKELTEVRRIYREGGLPLPKIERLYMRETGTGSIWAHAARQDEDKRRAAAQRAADARKELDRLPLNMRSSKHFTFWSTLEMGQEVRWTGTISATYFVVSATVHPFPPGGRYRYTDRSGAWIELRRHSGKTFWAPLFNVRPLPEAPPINLASRYDGPVSPG